MIKRNWTLFFIAITFSSYVLGQQISVNSSFTAQQLIEDNLVEGCVQVSNIESNSNGSVNGFSSFGYFERQNSDFPFENGILLSTGNADSAGNTENVNPLNEGDEAWQTDSDLETALGISNTVNATSIEFDFISVASQIQFNYILASEEYFREYPCLYSDGFAFLIKEAGTTNPYTNIALIPGTNIAVNTSTIHDEIVGFCEAENEQYFEGYNVGDTNFNGRTTVMSASATIQPNVQYHIKLVIADQTDRNFDSAVFIQANSFNDTVNLGENITTCDSNVTLDANIGNPDATFTWYQNNTEINGETNSTLNTSESGDYRVEIAIPLNNTTCTIEDSIYVQLNTIQEGFTLSDFELCDDSSNDESETFNLNTKTTEALTVVPAGNYTVTYHASQVFAANNTNAISTVTNAVNPQPIFVRIEDDVTGCVSIATFNLVVNQYPIINAPDPLQVCQNDALNIDLVALDEDITNANPNLSVSYHQFQTDAQSGSNPLSSPYATSGNSEEIYIRVENINTGCTALTTLTINTLENPQINPDIQVLDACEQDDDGFEAFDLTTVIDDVLQGLTDVTTSFHITEEEAQTGENPIPNITNFVNTEPDFQTIYIRVVGQNGCASYIGIELHTFVLETGTNIHTFRACDSDNDGIALFNLENIESNIIGELENVNIIFYETEENQQNQTNALDETVLYEVNTQTTLYITLITPDCIYESEIDLEVNPSFQIPVLEPTEYCDTDQDGLTSVDLTVFNDYVGETVETAVITYFETNEDATNQENEISTLYDNTTNPFTVFARVRNASTGCFDITPLEINVLSAPLAVQPSDLTVCDDDTDGETTLDLNAKNSEIIANETAHNFTFYLTEADANTATNAITTPENFTTSSQTIYIRVENSTTSCHTVVPMEVYVNTLPEFTAISNYRNCESDGNQIADFIFNIKDDEILNGQTGKQVLYFETENDAINRTGIIDKDTAYQNTSVPQTIYIRVENLTDQNCFDTSSFEIEVGSNPIYNNPDDWFVCDDNSNDGVATFDLNEIIEEVSENSPENLDISFYASLQDAESMANALPLNYTNTVNPQPIFVVVDNGTYCQGIETFELNIVQVPEVNGASALRDCDTDTDGSITFDLTVAELEVLEIRQDNVEISYFPSLEDLENDTNVITTPETYNNISNPQTAYIKIYNTVSECYALVPIELIVDLPPTINAIPEFNICENEDNLFILNDTIEALIGEQDNVTTSFHSTLEDAQNNDNPLDTNYNYTTSNDTVFIRAENTITQCFNTSSFIVQVEATPMANMPSNLESCDTDFDGLFVFDLSQQNSEVLGTQNPDNFTVSYFETETDAINNQNAIADLNYEAFNEQELFVRVENNTTHCFNTTSFLIFVNRKPENSIQNQVVCLDNLPLVVSAETDFTTDTYLWSTNATTSAIEITEIGTYSVTVTSQFGCQTTSTFTVTESEAANIEFTETVDFADPNNITISVSGIGTYLYQLDDGDYQTTGFFQNVAIGPHTITVIDINGCNPVTKDVVVIDTPKFVTPNGDGYFDTWHITGVQQLTGTKVFIYDRFGKLLTILKHDSIGWDGRYNGNMMPANDYWFVANVKYNGIEFDVKGHFALRL
ncbi:choice-of-anchor L domain-containing protein [Lacinutrix salivirga]